MSYIINIILHYYFNARHYNKYAKVLSCYKSNFSNIDDDSMSITRPTYLVHAFNYRNLNNSTHYNNNIYKLNSHYYTCFVKIKDDNIQNCTLIGYRIIAKLPKGYYLYPPIDIEI